MEISSSSSLNAQMIEKGLKKTLSNDVDCVFLLRKNHAGLNFTLWQKFDIMQQHDKDCEYATCFSCKKVYRLKKITAIIIKNNHKYLNYESLESGAMTLFATKCISTAHD